MPQDKRQDIICLSLKRDNFEKKKNVCGLMLFLNINFVQLEQKEQKLFSKCFHVPLNK